jgi:hypothetical protein
MNEPHRFEDTPMHAHEIDIFLGPAEYVEARAATFSSPVSVSAVIGLPR